MTTEDPITRALSATGWSLERLAEMIGYETRTLKRVQSGEVPLSQKLERILDRTVDDSKNGNEASQRMESKDGPPLRRIAIAGWAEAGEANRCEEITDDEDFIEMRLPYEQLAAVRVNGDSMEPEIRSGDIVILACSERPQHGDVVVARLVDEGVVCKRIQVVNPSTKTLRLMSSNPNYVPMERTEEQIMWAFPVVKLIRNFR